MFSLICGSRIPYPKAQLADAIFTVPYSSCAAIEGRLFIQEWVGEGTEERGRLCGCPGSIFSAACYRA